MAENMKPTTTAKLPKKTLAKINDPNNPAWTKDMLGAPVVKRGRGPQAAPTKVLTSIRSVIRNKLPQNSSLSLKKFR
jgi:hypothetical protein